MKIYGGTWSDIGQRDVNQDAVFYRQFESVGQYFVLCAVCDGVGGLEHGEIASGFLADRMGVWFDSVVEWIDMDRTEPEVLCCHLKDAAEIWNEELRVLCRERSLKTGSTMSMLMLVKNCYYIIHVGDSRIYHYLNGLERLTIDASVARMKAGRVKNYLDNYMGKSDSLQFQFIEGRIRGDEMFIVCSDGLYHNMAEDDAIELYRNSMKSGETDTSCRRMVRQMLERGERDNASIGVVIVKQEYGEQE